MNYNSELTFAKDLAYKAGAIMRKYFSFDIKSEMKDNITPVTIADLKINVLVVKSVQKKFPGHAVIGEEESAQDNNAEYTWICDPLDGTIPYSIGMPTSIFSLALYKKKTAVLGVLYDPYMDRLYHAVDGKGTYMNRKRTRVAQGHMTKGDCAGMVLFHPGIIDAHKLIEPILKKDMRLMQIQSFVYIVSYIASGKFKGAVLNPSYVWDRAASKIILENAGGMMTDEKGETLDIFANPKMIIASNGDSHKELVDITMSALI